MTQTVLEDLLNQQDESIHRLRDYLSEHRIDDVIAQNEQLQNKVAQLLQKNQQLLARMDQQDQRIIQQRATIAELLLEIKTNLLQRNSRQLRKLLGKTETAGYQQFIQSRQEFELALQKLKTIIRDLDQKNHKALMLQLNDLKSQVQDTYQQERELLQTESQKIAQHLITVPEQTMLAQPIPDALLDQTISDNKLETKLGLKGFNYIGIGFIFLAMLVLGRLGIHHISDSVKSGLIFAMATLFGIGGEYLRRKGKQVFAQGLLGGAFGLSYMATFMSYFLFHLFSKGITLALLLVIASLTFGFAALYRSRAIGSLAIIGGYVPLISYLALTPSPSSPALLVARFYVLLITTVALQLAQRFQWRAMTLLAFILVTPWLYLFALVYPAHLLFQLTYEGYFLFQFVGLPLYAHSKNAIKLSALDVVSVIGMLQNFSLVSLLSVDGSIRSYQVLLVLGLNLVLYLILHWGITRYLTAVEMGITTGLIRFSFVAGVVDTFAIALVWVPWRFAMDWVDCLHLMLVASSLLTLLYLYLGNHLKLQECRKVSLVAAIFYGVIWWCQNRVSDQSLLSCVAFGMMLVTFGLVQRHQLLKRYQKLILAILYLQGNIMLMSLIGTLLKQQVNVRQIVLAPILQLLVTTLVVMVSQCFEKFKQTLIPVVHSFFILMVTPLLNVVMGLLGLSFWELVSLHILNLAVCFIAYRLVRRLYFNHKMSLVLSVISFSSYFMMNALLIAYSNFHFAYLTISFDVGFGLIALGYIIYGFKQHLQGLRVTGLGLMLLAMAKLLLLDISYSSLVSRMLVLLIFGCLSLLISYLYQTVVKQHQEVKDE